MPQNRKPNVLWVSESSFLNTGFSVLSKEILEKLLGTWKFHIYEYGSYAKDSDPRAKKLNWPFMGAIPEDHEQDLVRQYRGSQYGQFGETLFERVCLEVKPDIVIASRDYWMDEFILRSSYRNNFKVIWMPTVDGYPQKAEWMDKYHNEVDLILTYSQFGKDQMEKQQPDVNVFDVVRPGVNPDLYKPMDKKLIRRKLGVPEDAYVITSVMRNQKRKLFPDLIETFSKYLKYCLEKGDYDKANNTYLYLHTSYPDVGFDIGRHIMQNGVANRVLMTYNCKQCGAYYADFFKSEISHCKRCGQLSAFMPNTGHGVSREALAEIHNVGDLYIQYSIAEGLGIPIVEAKACGVPAFALEHSAMTEQVKDIPGCRIIKTAATFHEAVIETEQERVLPDHKDCVRNIYEFFNTSESTREVFSKAVRKDVVENYSYERSAKIFEKAIDSLEYDETQESTWLNPNANFLDFPNANEIPRFNSKSDMVDWALVNILKKPELLGRFFRNQLIKGLNTGVLRMDRFREMPLDDQKFFELIKDMVNQHNYWEDVRLNKFIKSEEQKDQQTDWMIV